MMQLLGGVSKGMALLTMDQEYVNRFRTRSVTLRQRFLQGVQAAGVGVYEGFLGKTSLEPGADLLFVLSQTVQFHVISCNACVNPFIQDFDNVCCKIRHYRPCLPL